MLLKETAAEKAPVYSNRTERCYRCSHALNILLFSDPNGRYCHIWARRDTRQLLIAPRLVAPAVTRQIIRLLDSFCRVLRITLMLILIPNARVFLKASL